MINGASKGYVVRVGGACIAIMGIISLVMFLVGRVEDHDNHERRDSIAAYRANVSFDALDGHSDTMKALIRVAGEKKFNEAFR